MAHAPLPLAPPRRFGETLRRDAWWVQSAVTFLVLATFVVYDVIANQWRAVEEDDALRERQFPEGIIPNVVVEGRSIVLDRKKRDKELDDYSPDILIFANGDLSSFEVALQREGTRDRARLYTDEQSELRLLLPGEVEQKGPPVRTAASR